MKPFGTGLGPVYIGVHSTRPRDDAQLGMPVKQSEATMTTVLTRECTSFNRVDHPSQRHLRQQEFNTVSPPFRVHLQFYEYHLREGRTRLPELGKKVIEVRPTPKIFFSNGLSDVLIGIEEG